MKILALISLIMLCSVTLSAQHRYAVGINASLHGTAPNSLHIDSHRNWIFTKGIGISILKFKDNRTFYKFGVNYQQRDLRLNNQVDGRFYRDSAGVMHVREVGMKDMDYHFNYVSIPIMVNYKILNRQGSNLFISGGIEPEWLYKVRYHHNSTYDGKATHISHPTKDRFSTLVHAGIGWYKPVGTKWLLLVQPQFIYRVMLPDDRNDFLISWDEASNNEPYNLGFNIELHYKLWQP